MVKLRFKYLVEDVDRHGNVRLYVRLPGRTKIRIKAEFGSDAFLQEYQDAVAGKTAAKAPRRASTKATPGTLRWLATEYFSSPEFKILDRRTQRVRRNIIEEACRTGGEAAIRDVTSRVILKGRDRRAETPSAANNFMKAMSGLFNYAALHRLVDANPVKGVPRLPSPNPDGWHTWTPAEVAKFVARHPEGTQAHLALSLLIYVGCRRSDVVQLGRQHITNGWLEFTATKNRRRRPVRIEVPVLEPLKRAIEAGPTGDLTFLVTKFGAPFSGDGFGNKFRTWCAQAGLPHCSAHGLRKAAATIAAESGATDAEMNAIFGWRDPDMAAHYTRSANRKRLAKSGMEKVAAGQDGNKSVPLSEAVRESGTENEEKARKINAEK